MRHVPWHWPIVFSSIVLWSCATGCSSRGTFANENDVLRRKVLELEGQVKDLERRNAELQAEVFAAAAAPQSIPPEIRENTPHVAELKISRLSHARDEDGDGVMDLVALYIEPRDGRGRFTQLVGPLSVNAAVLPAQSSASTIGTATFSPAQVRDAYRSGLTGLYYVINVPIELNAPSSNASTCTVRAVYTDGYTGQEHAAERAIALTAAPAAEVREVNGP
jgi:hypothetical protein